MHSNRESYIHGLCTSIKVPGADGSLFLLYEPSENIYRPIFLISQKIRIRNRLSAVAMIASKVKIFSLINRIET